MSRKSLFNLVLDQFNTLIDIVLPPLPPPGPIANSARGPFAFRPQSRSGKIGPWLSICYRTAIAVLLPCYSLGVLGAIRASFWRSWLDFWSSLASRGPILPENCPKKLPRVPPDPARTRRIRRPRLAGRRACEMDGRVPC